MRKILAVAVMGMASHMAMAEVTIGVTLSATGPAASLGIAEKNTFALLPKTLGGEPVRYVILDDASDSTAAAKNARKLVTEDKVDAIIGSSTFPTAIAVAEVAAQEKVPQLALAPGLPPPSKNPWAFSMPQTPGVMNSAVVEHMQKVGVKTVAFLGFSDSLGDSYMAALKPLITNAGIRLVADERYERVATSVVAQVLKVMMARPDAVFIASSGTPAALPQITMAERGYSGQIYQTTGAVGGDYLRVGGKVVEGTIAPTGPIVVSDQLPAGDVTKALSVPFNKAYEDKYGSGTRNTFAGYSYDAYLLLDSAVKVAIARAKPGTADFRSALRDALERGAEVPGTHGVYKFTSAEHASTDPRSRVLVKVVNGAWVLLR